MKESIKLQFPNVTAWSALMNGSYFICTVRLRPTSCLAPASACGIFDELVKRCAQPSSLRIPFAGLEIRHKQLYNVPRLYPPIFEATLAPGLRYSF